MASLPRFPWLPAIKENTESMAEALKSLSRLEHDLKLVQKDMRAVAEGTHVLPGMDERMANIEGAMPVLVEVQRHLARVPDTLERLDANMNRLDSALDRLLASLEELGEGVQGLQQSIEPLGRLAQRVPGRNRD